MYEESLKSPCVADSDEAITVTLSSTACDLCNDLDPSKRPVLIMTMAIGLKVNGILINEIVFENKDLFAQKREKELEATGV